MNQLIAFTIAIWIWSLGAVIAVIIATEHGLGLITTENLHAIICTEISNPETVGVAIIVLVIGSLVFTSIIANSTRDD